MLITGAAGLVGVETCSALSSRGWAVRALVRDPARAASHLAHIPVELRVGDVRDESSLRSAIEGAGTVVHLAAIALEKRGATYETTNTGGTKNVLSAASATGVDRIVHMSQNGASSGSPYPFLRSKGIAEDFVTASGLKWTVLRPSVIFGPGDEFVNVLARLVRISPLIFPLPGGGSAMFQPIAVRDVGRVIAAVLQNDAAIGQRYSLGGPEALTLRQMTARILEAMGTRRALVPLPVAVMRPLVAALEKILPNPPVTAGLLDLLAVDNTVPDNATPDMLGETPDAFTPESLGYLKKFSAMDALSSLFGRS